MSLKYRLNEGRSKRNRAADEPAAAKKSRKNRLKSARQEIEAMGLGGYCSVLQFANISHVQVNLLQKVAVL
jgi:hypothetical protein